MLARIFFPRARSLRRLDIIALQDSFTSSYTLSFTLSKYNDVSSLIEYSLFSFFLQYFLRHRCPELIDVKRLIPLLLMDCQTLAETGIICPLGQSCDHRGC